MVVDVLTPEQKQYWEQRKDNLKGRGRIRDIAEADMYHELLNQRLAGRFELTEGQASAIRQFYANVINKVQNRSNDQEDKFKDLNAKLASFLTPDQKITWDKYQADLQQKLDAFKINQAVRNAHVEAKVLPISQRQPAAPTHTDGQRNQLTPTQLNSSTQDRILELQNQVEALKSQIEKLTQDARDQKQDSE